MNVDQTTTAIAIKSVEGSTSTAVSSTKKTSSSSFQDELKSVNSNDSSASSDSAESTAQSQSSEKSQTSQTSQSTDKTQSAQNTENSQEQKSVDEKTEQQVGSSKENAENETKQSMDPVSALSAKIAAINELKTSSNSQFKGVNSSSSTSDTKDTTLYGSTMKMNNQDIGFFVNLVNNQQNNGQSGMQAIDPDGGGKNFSEIQTEATQSTVRVSATLMDAINDSAKTGKPFRIDFDNDVAVVMKVDSKGVLSANFIPGSSAVENYLRNNIEGLRQSFDNQDLPYNELTYSQQQKQDKEQNSKQNKEKNSDE